MRVSNLGLSPDEESSFGLTAQVLIGSEDRKKATDRVRGTRKEAPMGSASTSGDSTTANVAGLSSASGLSCQRVGPCPREHSLAIYRARSKVATSLSM